MNDLEHTNSFELAIKAAIGGALAGTWTALPGIIQTFDPVKQTATVQPAIQAEVTDARGKKSLLTLPILLDCPVHFPAGGGCVMTFPVKQGDECLVVFAARCIDAWWQQGGIQPQAELRMHDLSDGFAFVGFSSVPHVPANISTTAAQLRSVDGQTVVSLDPTGKTLVLTAPNGATVNANVQVNGNLHVSGTITGDTDVLTGSISLKNHHHTGVTAGGAQTGAPV